MKLWLCLRGGGATKPGSTSSGSTLFARSRSPALGTIWQGFGFSKNGSGFWWSGFSDGAGVVLQNVWQNNFTCWIEVA